MALYDIPLGSLILKLKKQSHQCTLLGIGPVSRTVIRAAFEVCTRVNCPPIFIASRNQVDLESLGHGYLMGGMDQCSFVNLIDHEKGKAEYQGPVYICRDHGGPWQRNKELEKNYPVQKAMEIAKLSFKADIEAGFNFLHIDPTKCPFQHTLDDICTWTVELIEYCETVRKEQGVPCVDYEVGTENIQGGLTAPKSFETFLEKLTHALKDKQLPLPACVVGQTGTLTRGDCNVGHFDKKTAHTLAGIADKFGIGFKEHNADYLSSATCSVHPDIGITGANVAPEFGLIETDAYLYLSSLESKLVCENRIDDNKASHIRELLIEKTFPESPWRKWLPDEFRDLPDSDIKSDPNLRVLIARVCGHYVYNNDKVKHAIKVLFANINSHNLAQDAEYFVLEQIRDRIESYMRLFRMHGINSMLMYQKV